MHTFVQTVWFFLHTLHGSHLPKILPNVPTVFSQNDSFSATQGSSASASSTNPPKYLDPLTILKLNDSKYSSVAMLFSEFVIKTLFDGSVQ
mmetsp:Transcript_4150/g.6032  ORF Transcript_4150/g.6032 Transcript_4150/m.6032 type:complete len:91 (-) Transcript_4150:1232-1504(-)